MRTRESKNPSRYITYLLRHRPQALGLHMDEKGWVSVDELLNAINRQGRYHLTKELLDGIVRDDDKQRYAYSEDGTRIKACQGHTLTGVEPELLQATPPARLYHGTTESAYQKILAGGAILKMERHAVHLQADAEKSWQSAMRWVNQDPVLLVIDTEKMICDGYSFGITENAVWCTEIVPAQYILEVLHRAE